MTENLEEIREEVEHDVSPEWVELSADVRKMAVELRMKANGNPLEADVEALLGKLEKLCDHVEVLHGGVADLLTSMGEPDHEEILVEKIKVEREMHEFKENPKENVRDVIKALFMWRDDPVERVRQKSRIE